MHKRGLAVVAVAAAALAGAAALATAGAGDESTRPAITAVRLGAHPQVTRFVLDMTVAADFNVFTLADPYRVVIDLPDMEWRPAPGAGGAVGLIDGFRYGVLTPGVFRVVLDASQPVEVRRAYVLAPEGDGGGHRLVVDLGPTDRDAALAALAPPPRLTPAPGAPGAAAPSNDELRPLVAIDAGHGGVDPGAVGADGVFEKDIVLDAARTLAATLRATGRYRTALIRDADLFIRLRDRVAMAHDMGADVFISLHADAHADARVRGASVYTLSDTASDAEAAALAAKENRADLLAGIGFADHGDVVGNILLDLMMDATARESIKLAEILVDELGQVAPLLPRPHRFAGFAVLRTPGAPAVLVEMGYVSNGADETALADAAHLEDLAGAVTRAIDAYFAARGGA